MSQIDDLYFDKPKFGFSIGASAGDIAKKMDQDIQSAKDDYSSKVKSWEDKINSILNDPNSYNITDRSQIINPASILKDFFSEFTDSAHNQSLYNQYLQSLQNLQAQQNSLYEEWYNSPVQQVIRDRSAGLNTDILGLSGSSAAQSSLPSESPISGVPSLEEQNLLNQQIGSERINRLIGLVGSLSSVANLASSFSNISINKANKDYINTQTAALKLANLKDFENITGSEISSRLSDSIASALASGSSLDIAEWFSNDDNFAGILETYAPDTSSAYADSFSNVRKRMQRTLGSAYEQGRVTAENQSNFSAVLADPRYSADQLVQIAQLRPYIQAKIDMQKAQDEYDQALAEWNKEYQQGLSVEYAVDASNSKFEYDSEYLKEMDGKKQAIYDILIKEQQAIAARMRKAIDSNLLSIYEKYPNDMRGFSAAYLFDNAGKEWYEFLAAQSFATGLEGFKRDSELTTKWNGVEFPATNPPSFTGASPSPSGIRGFIPPGGVAF